ncbi:MAG: hypothetical protein HRT36_05475 [Alphaproteobacteria bacterium]|nr:hypothetical protein [Alphaproteobacteria bacterium]
MMMFFDIQPGVRDPIMIMIGFLGGSFSAVVGFYFGSSQSSQAKDGMLGRTNNCAGKCSP